MSLGVAARLGVLGTLLILSGCFGGASEGTEPGSDSSETSSETETVVRAKGPIPIVTAPPAQDHRFGADRPLTMEDIPSLLPTDKLTDYNVTREYLLSMVPLPEVQLYELGLSLENRVLFGILITDDGAFHPDRPTVDLTCTQHGNEPSGSEACLVLIEYFVHGTDQYAKDVRTRLNVIMNPLANPDGKEANQRANYEGFDINRDHMNMVTFEGRAIHEFYNLFDPEVILDLHEFGGAGIEDPLPPQVPVSTYDYFEVAAPQTFYNNDAPMLRVNWDLEAQIMQEMWERYGIGSSTHYGSPNFVSSIQRNHYGMHNGISLLFETGGGSGTNRIDLRTSLHIVATFVVLDWMLADPQAVLDLEAQADGSASQAQPGIVGWVVPNQTESPKLINFLEVHHIAYEILDADASFLSSHYVSGPDSVPQERSFPAGSLHVSRFQPDGRVAYEIFEAVHDEYYDHGPRDWELDAYRIIEE